MRRARSLLAPVLITSLFLAPSPAARAARLTCRDGVPKPIPGFCNPVECPVVCDADRTRDGVCTFVLCIVESSPGRTRTPFACRDESFIVPVGEKRKIVLDSTRDPAKILLLRCRHHPRGVPCPTTTTTMPAPSTCSSNADCRVEGNPCMPGFCGGGMCQPDCVCIAPDFTAACSPEQAIHCPNPDCHPLLGDPCIHCAENGLCVTFPDCD